MAKRKRDYENDFPSVTEVLNVLRKPGLEMWYRVNTPQFINEAMAKGKSIGTATHEAIESYITTGELKVDTEWPDEVTMALQSFVLFKKEHPEIILKSSEKKMTSDRYFFNGTMDVIGEIEGKKILGDWKTTACKDKEKPEIYDEARTQISAYRELYAEYEEYVNSAFILSLAKDKVAYNLEFLGVDEMDSRFKEIFLPALSIKNYSKKHKQEKKDAV